MTLMTHLQMLSLSEQTQAARKDFFDHWKEYRKTLKSYMPQNEIDQLESLAWKEFKKKKIGVDRNEKPR